MSDSTLTIGGSGGDSLDAELIGSVKRFRPQIGGAALAELLNVRNVKAVSADYGAVVRPVPARDLAGVYGFSDRVVAVRAAADNGTTTGTLWWENPVAGAKNARLRRFSLMFTHAAAIADTLSVPLLTVARFTFTGTASGTVLAVGKRKSTDAANTTNWRIASTGMTVSLVASLLHGQAPALELVGTTTTGAFSLGTGRVGKARSFTFAPDNEDDYIDIAPGEGVVVYQSTAGTTADKRSYSISGVFDEYTP